MPGINWGLQPSGLENLQTPQADYILSLLGQANRGPQFLQNNPATKGVPAEPGFAGTQPLSMTQPAPGVESRGPGYEILKNPMGATPPAPAPVPVPTPPDMGAFTSEAFVQPGQNPQGTVEPTTGGSNVAGAARGLGLIANALAKKETPPPKIDWVKPPPVREGRAPQGLNDPIIFALFGRPLT